jgi:hypothetical protein
MRENHEGGEMATPRDEFNKEEKGALLKFVYAAAAGAGDAGSTLFFQLKRGRKSVLQ